MEGILISRLGPAFAQGTVHCLRCPAVPPQLSPVLAWPLPEADPETGTGKPGAYLGGDPRARAERGAWAGPGKTAGEVPVVGSWRLTPLGSLREPVRSVPPCPTREVRELAYGHTDACSRTHAHTHRASGQRQPWCRERPPLATRRSACPERARPALRDDGVLGAPADTPVSCSTLVSAG